MKKETVSLKKTVDHWSIRVENVTFYVLGCMGTQTTPIMPFSFEFVTNNTCCEFTQPQRRFFPQFTNIFLKTGNVHSMSGYIATEPIKEWGNLTFFPFV